MMGGQSTDARADNDDLHDITSLNSYRLNGPERLLNSLNEVRSICASAISGNSDVGEKPLSA